MCLIKDSENTVRYTKTIRSKGGKIRCWKILNIHNNTLIAPYYIMEYKVGINVSSRRSKEINSVDDPYTATSTPNVRNGIHVYKRKPRKNYYLPYDVLVPVICDIKDFVASSRTEAVFMKVFIKKRDYKNALRANK